MKKILLITAAALCIFAFAGCEKKVSDDAVTVSKYISLFDEPASVEVTKLEKYEFEGNIDIYNAEFSFVDEYGEGATAKLLIKHVKKSPIATLCFWSDINSAQHLHADVKELWDARITEATANKSFNASEISKIKKEAVEYLEALKNENK